MIFLQYTIATPYGRKNEKPLSPARTASGIRVWWEIGSFVVRRGYVAMLCSFQHHINPHDGFVRLACLAEASA